MKNSPAQTDGYNQLLLEQLLFFLTDLSENLIHHSSTLLRNPDQGFLQTPIIHVSLG